MALLTALIRRTLWLLMLGLVAGAAYRWWRERQAPTVPAAAEWPPISVPDRPAPVAEPADAPADVEPAVDDASEAADAPDAEETTTAAEPASAAASEPIAAAVPDEPDEPTEPTGSAANDEGTSTATGTASVVNALVDAPEARSTSGADATWIDPDDDGGCPLTHPIKANDNSGIFHVPGGRFYDRTKAERCYVDADAAAADGYRRAKS